eukprot:TRINITY_DN1539_c0_g1_i10.p1 TRINITY_DN1539_c0_g1~~TRINITY_DN1539_c0_g1_i10.p1  ORF type:complete len:168 (-),score=45.54 TRINITY_DN1539_c0_g1_i10:55-558(-)
MEKRFKLVSVSEEAKVKKAVLEEVDYNSSSESREEIEELHNAEEYPKVKLAAIPSLEANRSYFGGVNRESSSSVSTVHCLPKATNKFMEYRRNAKLNTRSLNSKKKGSKSMLVNNAKNGVNRKESILKTDILIGTNNFGGPYASLIFKVEDDQELKHCYKCKNPFCF